ncbi:hypothetical protein M4438_33060 [Streptomyces lavenduligriseus]|uniref:Thioesterase domain-containing protein n=2 Tax=Streptomyces lavenduligriseus TaxID=67315 RepID=A0ABT0P3F3_9ACTN|nr:thioesterase domain-containing protein [Streptomyces lavenduligriseus]MCL3998280.1 hypothetical protein [Streptomyces lavenduligriseus]
MLDPLLATEHIAFFGQSMGAIIVFETARRLESSGRPGPVETVHFHLSGIAHHALRTASWR